MVNINYIGDFYISSLFVVKLLILFMFYQNLLSSVRLEQGTVTSLVKGNGIIKGVEYKTKNGEKLTAYAPLTVVCDGCCSNLRRTLCNPKVNIQS